MKSAHHTKSSFCYKGILRSIKNYLRHNRLGELLLIKGLIDTKALQEALRLQKENKAPLGSILVERALISKAQLRSVLGRQILLRCTATLLFALISMGGGFSAKRAHADIRDIPAPVSLHVAAFNEVSAHQPLFGYEERRSSDLKAFTKWSEVFERFEQEIDYGQNEDFVRLWHDKFGGLKSLSFLEKIERVNEIVNAQNYIIDSNNWGKSDYWETPTEFFARGGDCEDFAITKYVALRTLGVPESRLRLAVVHDNEKNIPHAILVVYTDEGSLILDNQMDSVMSGETMYRYRPIFSINRTAWWLHTSGKTRLASVQN